jgi:uncharacterized membrane protein YdjX (TVP38/TMEM64 family)
MSVKRFLLLALIAAVVVGFFAVDSGHPSAALFGAVNMYDESSPWGWAIVFLAFFVVYMMAAALLLPGITLLSLAVGVVFDLMWGAVLVSFASTIGATLAFLAARFFLRDAIQKQFGDKLRAINQGIERDGALYLFALRLAPVFPFFIVNLVMALTPIRTSTFYLMSQLGMLPGTILYVYAGTQIAKIESVRDILSPELIISLSLVGIFPIVAKKLIGLMKAEKNYKTT